jgi:tetratricopeptide (TPR) repeat protein
MRALAFGLALATLPLAAGADEIYLKSGGQLSGRILSRTATTVEIDIGGGQIGVAMSTVARIEEGRSTLHEYQDRAGRIAPGDVEAWVALAAWASSVGLGSQATEAYNRALHAAPNDPRANAGVGNVQVGGRWVSEEEGYRAQGYVRFEGEWISPTEHDAILKSRALEVQEERVRQAEDRAHEAQVRAEEAEARLAEAKAAEAQENQGLPLWYGWGVGPVSWNTGSIAMQPIQTLPTGVPR